MSPTWEVHKFGGTSVLNADRYKGAFRILTQTPSPLRRLVVVSAMKGVTDDLIQSVDLAKAGDSGYLEKFNQIIRRHETAIAQLLPPQDQQKILGIIHQDQTKLLEILRGIFLAKTSSEVLVELISGHGEVWSAQIFNTYFQSQGLKSAWLDAREIITVTSHTNSVDVDWGLSKKRLDAFLSYHEVPWIIATGFVAQTHDGTVTTLKRNGSDHSATIFGSLLDASEVVIWTDVDGVFSADPRLVPEAIVLDEVSYDEIAELAYFGAKVVHPATMEPVIKKRIPVWVRNTFRPDFAGTRITHKTNSSLAAKGFSAIEKVSLVNLEGQGMVGVPGIAERLFASLRHAGVSVILISQASSEHSICLAVADSQAEQARTAIDSAFAPERLQGLIENVQIHQGCSILAVVGDNMVNSPGLAGRFFGALGRARVNIQAIAQGSSERNISAVIGGPDTIRGLRAAHSSFFLSNQVLDVGLIGPGLIGKELLKQIQNQLHWLSRERKLDIRLRGIMNSTKMVLSDRQQNGGLPRDQWLTSLETSSLKPDLNSFIGHLQDSDFPHHVVIDATASNEMASHYVEWLQRGLHIVTPNKKAHSGSLETYQKIKAAAQQKGRYFLYSTTVGAGLPILQALRDLHQTGDQIALVEGIVSGTLSFLFSQFDGTLPFSHIVIEAQKAGYTEPDPRDDLSGMDVARKLVIMARECGFPLELAQIDIESLVPSELKSVSRDEYIRRLPEFDGQMLDRVKQAQSNLQALRYIARLEKGGKASVRLSPVPMDHPFMAVRKTDNIVAVQSERYASRPLVIQGPGAGPEVTASGIFADLLKLHQFIGADA